jgi:glycosyltransferase involved in cell wall biosynthesis
VIRVVYINTTGSRSGALVSLIETVRNLEHVVDPILLTPRGSAVDFAKRTIRNLYQVPWLSQFDHTRYGRYRGTRWFIGMREFVLLPLTLFHVFLFARKVPKVDLIHLNEITGIIPAVFLKLRLKVPLIVHVRANMGTCHEGVRSRLLWYLTKKYVTRMICIDQTVKSTIPPGIDARVVHNTLDLSKFRNQGVPQQPAFQTDSAGIVNVGIVGTIIRVKGVFEFVEAAISICRVRDDAKFFIVGAGVRKLNRFQSRLFSALRLTEDAEAMVTRRIAEASLGDQIMMMGHIDDIGSIYEGLDVLCFPSHYDAPGRPIFEAAYFGKPSIVAIEKPMPDTLIDKVTGLAIRAHDVAALRQAILSLLDDPAARRRMGIAAKQLALAEFDPKENASKILAIYEQAIGPHPVN